MNFLRTFFGSSTKAGTPTQPSSSSLDGLLTDLGSKSPTVKTSAVMSIAMLSQSAVDPLLRKVQAGKTAELRRTAAKALGILGNRRAVEPLCDVITKEQDLFVFEEVAKALGYLADGFAVNALITLLDTAVALAPKRNPIDPFGTLDIKRASTVFVHGYRGRLPLVKALGSLKDTRGISVLIEALADEEWYVSWAAAEVLASLGDQGVDALVAALDRCSKRDLASPQEEPDTQEPKSACDQAFAILLALGGVAEQRLVPVLIKELRNADWRVRREAAKGLGAIGDPQTAGTLVNSLSDSNSGVQMAAARALSGFSDRRGCDFLITLASSRKDVKIQRDAVVALGEVRGERVTEILTSILKDSGESEVARWAAASALGHLGDGKGFDLLNRSLSSKEKDIRRDTAKALGDLGDNRAIENLATLLSDSDEDVQLAAACALARFGDRRCLDVLFATLLNSDLVHRQVPAIEALGQSGRSEAVAPLVLSLRGSMGKVRKAIIAALTRLGTPAKDAVHPLLSDPRPLVRDDARLVFDQITARQKDETAVDLLLQYGGHPASLDVPLAEAVPATAPHPHPVGVESAAVATDRSGRFLEAVQQGDVEQVKTLLAEIPDLVFCKDKDGYTALHWAVGGDDTAIVEVLLASKAEYSVHDAAAYGDLEKVKELLEEHPEQIFSENVNGFTPLHSAAVKGRKDVAELLLANGAAVGAKDSLGCTPLTQAVVGGHKDVAALLLAKGAESNTADNTGLTPLHWVATLCRWKRFIDLKDTAELLLTRGANVDARNSAGRTPLHLASDCNITGYDTMDVVKWLLAHRADVNAKDNAGNTPLHLAAFWGHMDITTVLLAHGADVDARDNAGRMPLQAASKEGRKDMVDLLRQHGASE